MVALHYPPFEGGSGVHRTLKFSRYLSDHGWQPVVLSAHPRAFPYVGSEQLDEIPSDLVVERAWALDSRRHLAIHGRFLRALALPDPWISWWFGAVWSGLRLIRDHKPAFIWSTYPIATAQLIGYTLHRLSGVPWVADLRDSMTEDNYPPDRWMRHCYLWIERKIVRYAARIVFTTPSTRRMYLERYPSCAPARCVVIENGYDEEDFVDLPTGCSRDGRGNAAVRMVHPGVIYTDDRDPRAFFNALARLKSNGLINADLLKVDLRASGSEELYTKLLAGLAIDDIVRLRPAIPHRQALLDCARSDALLLFQAASCNHQIPAKVYEYLRLRKPILGLTPREGDTGILLGKLGGATIVNLSDEAEIYRTLPVFLEQVRNNLHSRPSAIEIRSYSRAARTSQLATLLNQTISSGDL